jgi:hypothetical protein
MCSTASTMAVHAIHPLCARQAFAEAANHCFLEWKTQHPTWANVRSVHHASRAAMGLAQSLPGAIPFIGPC